MRSYIISCEHGGNDVPESFASYFNGQSDVLHSHKGWDRGALQIAQGFAAQLNQELIFSTVSRLLIEQNRTLKHPELFSAISETFTKAQKQQLIEELYLPYIEKLGKRIENLISKQKDIIHVSVHSFTPILNGSTRTAEIGILYDPANQREVAFANEWSSKISKNTPKWRVKMNYPYLGTDDGLTAYFRQHFKQAYAGVELEINAKLFDEYSIELLIDKLTLP